jgi:hypothetical protein
MKYDDVDLVLSPEYPSVISSLLNIIGICFVPPVSLFSTLFNTVIRFHVTGFVVYLLCDFQIIRGGEVITLPTKNGCHILISIKWQNCVPWG